MVRKLDEITEYTIKASVCTMKMVIPHLVMWQYVDGKRFRPKKHIIDYFWP
jgi:hypothetical protein